MFSIPVIILSTLTGTANFGMDSYVPESGQATATAIVGGLNSVKWPGRFEVLHAGDRQIVVDGAHKLEWLGKMDTASLKNKVASSIVAISAIHLLKIFMDAKNTENDKII